MVPCRLAVKVHAPRFRGYATDIGSHFGRSQANFQPLAPISFLERAAAVYPEHTAIVHGKDFKQNYEELAQRSKRLGSALNGLGEL